MVLLWRHSITPTLVPLVDAAQPRIDDAVNAGRLKFIQEEVPKDAFKTSNCHTQRVMHASLRQNNWMRDGPGKHFNESRSALFQRDLCCMIMTELGSKSLCAEMSLKPKKRKVRRLRDAFRLIFAGMELTINAFARVGALSEKKSQPIMSIIRDAISLFLGKNAIYSVDNDTSTWELEYLTSILLMCLGKPLIALGGLEQTANFITMRNRSLCHTTLSNPQIVQQDELLSVIHFRRSVVYMHLGSLDKSKKALTDAITAFDDFPYHLHRAQLSSVNLLNMSVSRQMFEDFKYVVKHAHVDDEQIVTALLGLAVLAGHPNGAFGTVAEGRLYFEEANQHMQRHIYLYGPDARCHEKPAKDSLSAVAMEMYGSRNRTEEEAQRLCVKLMSQLMSQANIIEYIPNAPMSSSVEKVTECAKCSVSHNVNLLRCGRCKSVSYCSRKCQTSDWARHKPGCTFMKKTKKELQKMKKAGKN